jgi:ABC-2 type transport system ATP-binding protein
MLSAYENLEYFGGLQGLEARMLKERIDYCVTAASLQPFLHKRVQHFSGGMKRRLNLAIGLLNNPCILYLDEPTVGVDTQSRNYLLEMIKTINREEKTTIIYTSHYMEEIEKVSDHIAILDEGHLILNGPVAELLKQNVDISIRVADVSDALIERVRRIETARIQNDCVLITRNERYIDNLIEVFSAFKQLSIEPLEIDSANKRLEALFLKLTRKSLRDA